MMRNPHMMQQKNEIIKNQSILDRSGLSTIVTVINIKSGPDEHHSPQREAGDATPRTSTQTPPQLKNIARIVATAPMDTIFIAV
mmetsp:Transcript_17507/g.25310  ORF Transcript_17507/g.25310 Transcript_17507/m.25310 type:complete len:84 (+) Transcript_17507:2620-2871(+)